MKKFITILLIFCLVVPLFGGLSTEASAAVLITDVRGQIEENGLDKSIKVLKQATEDDTVLVFINSPGGSVIEMLKMIQAMEHSRARHITTIVKDVAASAGAAIAISGDEIVVSDTSILLFHLGSATNTDTGEIITFSVDMDTSKLPKLERDYLSLMVNLLKKQGKELGLTPNHIYASLHGADGLILTGTEFKRFNFYGRGLRHNTVYLGAITALIKYIERGEINEFYRM